MIINSPQDLYSFLKDVNTSEPDIVYFMGIMYIYLNGCPCDAEKHWNNALSVYKKLNNSDLSGIKKSKNVEFLDFYLDGEFLFKA